MGLQKVLSWLMPRDDQFFTLLEQHAVVLAEAAQVMAAFPDKGTTAEAALRKVHELEHRGDDLVHSVRVALDETFVTPIDREDIHQLATALDNVLDYLYSAAQAFVAYDVHELSPAMRELIRILAESAQLLQEALPHIRTRHLEKLGPVRQQLIANEKRGDSVYQNEMAALYKNPAVDAKDLLRQQAVLDALEASLDSCQDAADVLENVAIKHA
jgi:uncharacterized protein Yka (UPF0111/DUF47 family)